MRARGFPAILGRWPVPGLQVLAPSAELARGFRVAVSAGFGGWPMRKTA